LVFGKKNKIEYDATKQANASTQDLFQNPQNYSFIHNYKVHYKDRALKLLASKVDLSINSTDPTLPENQLVVDEFHRRMASAVMHTENKERFAEASYHITNVEYKESIAMPQPASVRKSMVTTSPPQITVTSDQSGIFCRHCGNKMSQDSKFCNKCGSSVN